MIRSVSAQASVSYFEPKVSHIFLLAIMPKARVDVYTQAHLRTQFLAKKVGHMPS